MVQGERHSDLPRGTGVLSGNMRFVVVGAGLMGRAVVYDLARSRDVNELIVADFDRQRATDAVRQFGRGKARPAYVDVRETARLAKLLRGSDVVLNCAQYYWNVAVMKAALRARVNYLDLGGLFYVTRQQLRLRRAFHRAGRLALVGMGGTPGITNVMTRHLADQLDRVDAIRVYSGAAELNPSPDPLALPTAGLAHTFSIATILDEMTLAPVAFLRGRLQKQPLFSGEEVVRFPAPLGRLVLRHSLHSELATLPASFRSKGVREVSFKVNYDPPLIAAVRLLTRLGLLERRPIRMNGTQIAPRAVLEHLLKQRAASPAPGGASTAAIRDVEILRVVVTGRKAGRPRRLMLDATTYYSRRPRFTAVARDTGFPASIAAQMIARGEIQATGVRAPEEVVPPQPFFAELQKRGIEVRGSEWSERNS